MKQHRGFTLIELMITASIVAILAMIALPKFGNMIDKSREATRKGMLGSIRSALTLYYADNEGDYFYPYSAGILSRYLDPFPTLPRTSRMPGDWRHGLWPGCGSSLDESSPTPSPIINAFNEGNSVIYRRWANRVAANFFVPCSHVDTQGVIYSNY